MVSLMFHEISWFLDVFTNSVDCERAIFFNVSGRSNSLMMYFCDAYVTGLNFLRSKEYPKAMSLSNDDYFPSFT